MFEILTDKSLIRFSDFLELHREIFPEQLISDVLLRDLFDIDSAFLFLLKDNDTNTGFLFFQLVASEIEILDIGVRAECRVQGLASQLLTKLLGFATQHDVAAIHLEVRAKNVAALALYAKHHFQKTGLRKKYYQDGEDAVLLSLKNLRDLSTEDRGQI